MDTIHNDHSFHPDGAGPKAMPRQIWSLDFKATSAPVYHNGTLYISKEHQYLALDALTGKTIWSAALPGQGTAPAFFGKSIFVGGQHIDNHLYVFDSATGEELARYRTVSISAPVTATPIIFDDRVLFGAGKTIIALNALNFKKAWSAPLGKRLSYRPPVLAGDLLCASTDEGYGKSMVMALSLNDGREIWRTKTPDLRSNVSYANGVICYVDANSVFHQIDPATGNIIHSVPLLREDDFPNAPASHLVSNDEILLVTFEYNLFALRLQNPEWIWSFHSSGVIGQPIIADDCVYVANLHDSLFCLDLQTGMERFRVKTDVRSHFACGVGNGMLFMAGSMTEHHLMAFAEQA